MSLKKVDLENVLFLRYDGEDVADTEHLREVLTAECAAKNGRSVVLELVNATAVYSSEIGVFAQFIKANVGTANMLHLVVSNYVRELLTTMHIHKLPGIMIHSDMESVQKLFPNVDFSAG